MRTLRIIFYLKMFLLITALFIAGISSSFSQTGNLALSEINEDIIEKAKITVFIFLSPDCELSKGYIETINYLYGKHSSKDIKFYGIVSGKSSEYKNVRAFIQAYNIAIPIALDSSAAFANKFSAIITPEVFVVNKKGNILYKGAIDNWAYSLGKEEREVTERYLDDVLNSIGNKNKIKIRETTAFGTFIK